MKIIYTGDISFSRFFPNREKEELLAPEIKAYLQSADHIAANVECTVTETELTSNRTLNHCSSPDAADFFAKKQYENLEPCE